MMLLAKALYDNMAETPEELAVRRGDVVTVLEQDASGLQGWWLCSIKGRRGIIPGNRLRLLDKTLGERELAMLNEKNARSEGKAARRDWHQADKVVMPQRLGNMFVYDVPQRAGSPANNTDYDVPASRSLNTGPIPAPRSTNTDYDHPQSNRLITNKTNVTLDPAQQLHNQMLSLDHYDVPESNRSSTISMLSMGSNMSAASSGSGQHSSLCESERSSLDLSGHDTYDVPPPARVIPTPAARRPPPGTSMDGPMYDTPRSLKRHLHSKSLDLLDPSDAVRPGTIDKLNRSSAEDSTYDMPKPLKPVSRHCSADSGISLPVKSVDDTTYDVPVPHRTPPRHKSLDIDMDYDTPKPTARTIEADHATVTPSEFNVYDVPPRVTKDTGGCLKPSEEEEMKRASSGSSDSDLGFLPYDELRMELNAAMESIVSLQHGLITACSKLLGYVHPAWRTPDNLEPKVYEIKLATVSVKKSAGEFLDFARGALGNAAKCDDKRLTKKLSSAVETFSESLSVFSEHLQTLNKGMWPLVNLVREEDFSSDNMDALDTIVQTTRAMPECVRSISGLIQGNSLVLFKRNSSSQVVPLTSTPRPKSKAPPPVKPKPRLSVGNGNGVPLAKFVPKSGSSTPPPEPPSERRLPTPPGDSPPVHDTQDGGSCDSRQTDYDVPKAHARLTDVDNRQQNNSQLDRTNTDEYDYVSLTKDKQIKAPQPATQAARDSENHTPVYAQVTKEPSARRTVKSMFPPPEVHVSGLGSKFQERLDKLQKDSEEEVKIYSEDYDVPQSRPTERRSSNRPVSAAGLLPNDKIILTFYSKQVETHTAILINAIETFLKSIEEKQLPKMFITYSKFVILAAHKLVYIGDTLTRHLVNDNIRNDVMNHAYTLCELLKVTVTATKKAALDYPSVLLTQDMVDRVSEVSVAASALRNFLTDVAP